MEEPRGIGSLGMGTTVLIFVPPKVVYALYGTDSISL